MLRALISIYKTVFLALFVAALVFWLTAGVVGVIYGSTREDMLVALAMLFFGPVFTVFGVGSIALLIENNELLRRIADSLAHKGCTPMDVLTQSRKPLAISEGRKEPMLSSKNG